MSLNKIAKRSKTFYFLPFWLAENIAEQSHKSPQDYKDIHLINSSIKTNCHLSLNLILIRSYMIHIATHEIVLPPSKQFAPDQVKKGMVW